MHCDMYLLYAPHLLHVMRNTLETSKDLKMSRLYTVRLFVVHRILLLVASNAHVAEKMDYAS